MDFKKYTSRGIVLSRRNFSEADRILKIFTNDHGKVVLLAKGIRRLKSRKRGSLEIFSKIRFSASQTKTIDIITETVPEDLYLQIRNDLRRTSLAYYFVEIIDKVTADGERHDTLYDLVVEFMEKLKDSNNLKKLRLEFVYRVLVTLGYWPGGKELKNADEVLSEVLERKINSVRVGRKVLS